MGGAASRVVIGFLRNIFVRDREILHVFVRNFLSIEGGDKHRSTFFASRDRALFLSPIARIGVTSGSISSFSRTWKFPYGHKHSDKHKANDSVFAHLEFSQLT